MQSKVSGLKELEATLQKLGARDGTRVLRGAMFRAAKPIEDQAKSNAAQIANGSGALHESIGRRFTVGVSADRLGGKFTVTIAPIKKNRVAVALYNLFYQRKVRGIFYGHLVEFGTKFARAQPFLGPALNARASQAINSLAQEIRKGIDVMLKRRGKARG